MLLSVTFTEKLELVFVLTFENAFSQSFHFKANRKSIGSSKNRTRDFQNSPPFERSTLFFVTIPGHFDCFQYFDFETNFLENVNLFQKTGVPFFSWNYRFLDWNTSFPFKNTRSEANVKTISMSTTKLTYHKEWSFSSNCFIFLEDLFQF